MILHRTDRMTPNLTLISKTKSSKIRRNGTRRYQHQRQCIGSYKGNVVRTLSMTLCLLLIVTIEDSLWCTNAFTSIVLSRRNLCNYQRYTADNTARSIIRQNNDIIQLQRPRQRRTTQRNISENISGNDKGVGVPLDDSQKPKLVVNGSSTTTNNSVEPSSTILSSVIATSTSSTSTAIGTTPNTISNGKTSNNPPFLVTLDDASQHSYTEAVQRTIGWVCAAIIFGSTLWITNDAQTGEEFFAGYIVEQSLSIDNLFVFLLLFEYFQVPIQYQDRVLNWGIYGAIVMRAIMIGLGAAALQKFHAILLVFAAILVYSSVSFFISGDSDNDENEDPSQNYIVQFSRSLFPSTDQFDDDRFFTIVDGIRMATPLFICMIAVEISDVVFAVDSIPAVFGVTEVMFPVLYEFSRYFFLLLFTPYPTMLKNIILYTFRMSN
jgi:TerC family integral membrane protein